MRISRKKSFQILRFQDQLKNRWWWGMVEQLHEVEEEGFSGEMRVAVMGVSGGGLKVLCGEEK